MTGPTLRVICINNQCCSMQQHPGNMIMFPGNMTRRTSCHAQCERYPRQIKYAFCAAFVDFVSADVSVISSLKRFKKSFSFVYYIL